jgi:predicted ArsR family transcriptional regulator
MRQKTTRRQPGPQGTLRAVERTLEMYGFEPYRPEPDVIRLGNCPFRDLAMEAPQLVCEVNRSFLEGVIRGLGDDVVQAVLERSPGGCCVSVRSVRGGGAIGG